MRPLRYIPPTLRGRAMVEVTARTLQGRALLRPSSTLNRTYYGVLARAQQITETQIHAFCALSTHHHLLVSVRDAQELAKFMGHVQGNLSREVGRLHDWRGPLWERRYRGIVVAEEEDAQLARLVYLLEQGCKEGLVGSPLDWPGPNSAWALHGGHSTIQGDWVDRTGLYHARRRSRDGEPVSERGFTERLDVVLEPLPCWGALERASRVERVRDLVHVVEKRTRIRNEAAGTRPLGIALIRARHPHARPARLDRTPAPRFHTATRAAHRELVDLYNRVLAAHRRAAAQLRRGDLAVAFPEGTFPPPRSFIPIAVRA